jgi:outer membrane biogenesis lipoprotein LolB
MINRFFMGDKEPFPMRSFSDLVRLVLVAFVIALITACATTVRKEETLAESLKGWDTAQFEAYHVYAHGAGGSSIRCGLG